MFRFLPLISVKDITSQIYDAIITPITSAVSKAISVVLDTIINTVLIPALKPFFESLVEPILSLIGDVLLAWIHIRMYYLYVGILKIIDTLEYAFDIFSGVAKVKVIDGSPEGTSDFLLNVFFTNSGITTVFRAITILAFAVSLVFGIISVMKSSVDLDGNRPVGKVIGTIAKTGLTFLIIPFFTIFALNMTNVVIKKTDEILALSVGEERPSLGTTLFLATTLEAEENTSGENSTEAKIAEIIDGLKNNSSSGEVVGFTDGVRADYYAGKKDYWDFTTVSNDFNITQVKTVLGFFMSLFVAIMLIICTFVFITRIFEVLLLYIASPFFVATIPLDDGAKFDEWKNMFIAKLFSGFGMLIGMKLYIILVPIIMSSNLQLSSTNSVNMGLKVLFILGGAFAIYKSNSLLMQILNINASYGESATAATGFRYIMSAKNMGMRALKGAFASSGGRSGSRPQAALATSAGNRNPNLGTFSRASVSDKTNRNKNITIGSHRAAYAESKKIQIGSHRNVSKNAESSAATGNTWKNGKIPSDTKNSNSAGGNSYNGNLSGSSLRTNGINKAQSSSESNKVAGNVSKNASGTSNSFNGGANSAKGTFSSQSSTAKGTSNTFGSQSSSQTSKTNSTNSAESSKNTWKKTTPSNKNDEGNKF